MNILRKAVPLLLAFVTLNCSAQVSNTVTFNWQKSIPGNMLGNKMELSPKAIGTNGAAVVSLDTMRALVTDTNGQIIITNLTSGGYVGLFKTGDINTPFQFVCPTTNGNFNFKDLLAVPLPIPGTINAYSMTASDNRYPQFGYYQPSNNVTFTTNANGVFISAIGSSAWSSITGTPTTRSGYGITDAQPLSSALTTLAGGNGSALSLIPEAGVVNLTADLAAKLTSGSPLPAANLTGTVASANGGLGYANTNLIPAGAVYDNGVAYGVPAYVLSVVSNQTYAFAYTNPAAAESIFYGVGWENFAGPFLPISGTFVAATNHVALFTSGSPGTPVTAQVWPVSPGLYGNLGGNFAGNVAGSVVGNFSGAIDSASTFPPQVVTTNGGGGNQNIFQTPNFLGGLPSIGSPALMPNSDFPGGPSAPNWFFAGNPTVAVAANFSADNGVQMVGMNPHGRVTLSLGLSTTNAVVYSPGSGGSGAALTNANGEIIGYTLNNASMVMENDQGVFNFMPRVANLVNNGGHWAISCSYAGFGGIQGDWPWIYTDPVSGVWGTPHWDATTFTNIHNNAAGNSNTMVWSFSVNPVTDAATFRSSVTAKTLTVQPSTTNAFVFTTNGVVVSNALGSVTIQSGNVTATGTAGFTGVGTSLTALSGSQITSGTINSNALDTATKNQLALAGTGGVSLSNYFCEASITSSSQSLSSSFTTIVFSTVVSDPGGNFSLANNWYVVPVSGVYMVKTSLRLTDGSGIGDSYGQGADITNADSPNFSWFVAAPNRNGSLNLRVSHFNAGDHIREIGYVDGTATMLAANMVVTLIYKD